MAETDRQRHIGREAERRRGGEKVKQVEWVRDREKTTVHKLRVNRDRDRDSLR